jgi:hypothetical protein
MNARSWEYECGNCGAQWSVQSPHNPGEQACPGNSAARAKANRQGDAGCGNYANPENAETFDAFAPDGARICGRLESVLGVALIQCFESADPDAIEWEGETKIEWDSQEPVLRPVRKGRGNPRVKEAIFIDEHGSEWLQSALTFKPSEE